MQEKLLKLIIEQDIDPLRDDDASTTCFFFFFFFFFNKGLLVLTCRNTNVHVVNIDIC